MRADRLVATLLLLQNRGQVTAAELARELEISVATARRDLEALGTAGVPVYPRPGRGGGWSLVGGARTNLSGLTAAEAQAMFVLAGPASNAHPHVRSALRKLVQALPGTFRADAQAAADAVVVDPAAWGDRDRPRPPVVAELETAVVRRRQVRFGYTSRAGVRERRSASPLGLVVKDEVWYLVADTERGERTFRVDRLHDLELTELAATRPAEFDLPAAWRRVVDEVEGQRSLVAAEVVTRARYATVLSHRFGLHCEVTEQLDADRVRLRLAAPDARTLAEQLAGWGDMVEVLAPASVREELGRIGGELSRRYRPTPSPHDDR